MSSVFISTPAEVVVVDSRIRSGTITLPTTNSIPNRVLNFKDQYGTFSNSTLTLSTQLGESFDDGATTKTFSNAYSFLNLYAVSSKWLVMGATQTVQQTISSLTVNQLTFGTGAGWVQFGPVQATVFSSLQLNTNDGYINNLYVGNQSTINEIQYYGLFGNYNNTVLAEISTGAGMQEFLVFKGSSTSDRVRVQTTGNFVVETGVSARLFTSNTLATLSNATPAFIINTSSNVGIQTANPGATLDVNGTARAINVSAQQLFVSSVNGGIPLLAQNLVSTVGGLGTAGYLSSLSLTSSLTSTVSGLTTSLISTTFGTDRQLISTTSGMNTQLISTTFGTDTQLISTTFGLTTYISSFIDPQELASSVLQFISSTYLTSQLTSTVEGLGSAGYISTGGQGIFSSVYINLLPQDAPPWDSNNYPIYGSNEEPSPLALDIFGSARILKNLYVGSTTTVIGPSAIFTPGVSTASISAATTTVSSLGLINPDTSESYFLQVQDGQLVFNNSQIAFGNMNSTIAGLGQAGYVSTSYLSNAVQFLTIPYDGLNVNTYFQLRASTNQLSFGTQGSKSQIYVGDILAAAAQYTNTEPFISVESVGFTTTGNQDFNYLGTDQTFTVPVGVTQLQVTLLGAGGGNELSNFTYTGGAGGYVQGTLNVTPGEVLTIVVGQAGGQAGSNFYGGGGASGNNLGYIGDGGGRSAIRRTQDVVTAGGGGGAGIGGDGGDGGGLTGETGGGSRPGEGGTQSAGGAAGGGGTSGTKDTGGTGDTSGDGGGGGGGGYYGGGGGGDSDGGGGGSSYVANLTGTVTNTQGGGSPAQTDGFVNIQWTTRLYRPANILTVTNYKGNKLILDPFLNLGVNVSSINPLFNLDVSGAGRMSSLTLGSIPYTGALTTNQTGNLFWNGTQINGGGSVTGPNLTSTVEGLGSTGYLSSLTGFQASTGFLIVSSINMIDINLGTEQYITVSSGVLQLNGAGITGGGSGGAGVSQLLAGTNISLTPAGGTGVVTIDGTGPSVGNLLSTVGGLGNAGYVSTLSFQSSLVSTTRFIETAFSSFSTAFGPGGGVNSSNLQSTVAGLGQLYISSIPAILSTSRFFTSSAVISTATANVLSSLQTNASSATITVGTISSVTTNTITLGPTSGWILTSPIQTAAVSTNTLYADNAVITTATITAGALSSVTTSNIQIGPGSGWILTSPIQTTVLSTTYSFADQAYANTNLIGSVSTVNSLQFYGLFGNYNNTVLAETSTGAGFQELLVFKGSSTSDRVRVQTTGNFVVETGVSARLWSNTTIPTQSNATPAFLINTSSNVGIQTASPGATLDVNGTARAINVSAQQLFISSINGALPGGVTTSNLQSTVGGLGQSYLSSIPLLLSSAGIFTSSLTASTITTSSLQVNSLTIGTGTGWLNLGPLQTVAISSIQDNTNALYANTSFFGTTSTATALQFFGLQGNYNNTVLAEVSTGAGFQEFLVFKGSSTSDRVRVQTTGNFVIETGVSARLWSNTTVPTTSNVTPAFIINSSSNVGIQTANPGATLDVNGTARAITLSSQQLFVSSINGTIPLTSLNLQSTVGGLGTAGYISSLSLQSTLTSTVAGLTVQMISTTFGVDTQLISTTFEINTSLLSTNFTLSNQFLSTVGGLGTAGYVSTLSLQSSFVSSTQFLETAFSSFSTAFGPGGGGGLTSANLLSTVGGLGNAGYVSTLSLTSSIVSTTQFLETAFSSFSTAFGPGGGGGLTAGNLQSTVAGLGQLYISSIPAVLSTSRFFTSSAIISTGTFNIVSTLVLNASTVTTTQITTSTIATNAMTIGSAPSWILTSPIQNLAISTNTLWADQAYITTGTFTTETNSTMTTNAITLGTGATWIQTSPIQTSVVSSIFMYANNPFFDTVNIGSVSTMNALEFYGLFGNYNNTVLAEISTGGGNQELLVFKGSSVSDRVRVQTTGNFVIETGVSARLFNSNTTQTLSNATPAFIVNSSSNVGIQTAAPGATLDVAGTGRFQTLSSLTLFASSIVAPYVFQPQFFTF